MPFHDEEVEAIWHFSQFVCVQRHFPALFCHSLVGTEKDTIHDVRRCRKSMVLGKIVPALGLRVILRRLRLHWSCSRPRFRLTCVRKHGPASGSRLRELESNVSVICLDVRGIGKFHMDSLSRRSPRSSILVIETVILSRPLSAIDCFTRSSLRWSEGAWRVAEQTSAIVFTLRHKVSSNTLDTTCIVIDYCDNL